MVRAVDHIAFDLFKGEIYTLVGESGCGKSSAAHAVMRLITRINAPGHRIGGKVIYASQNLLSLPEKEMAAIRGKAIGMIFQNPLDSLNPLYTSGYQVYEAIVIDNVPKKKAWERVASLFSEVKLSDPQQHIKSFPHELSGGMRQRVMISMMLSRRPQLLIADEPTTALDVTIQARILELILELKKLFGLSVWVITHDFGIVAEIADRVGVMYAGVLVEESDVYRIFDHPTHPYTQMLMESLPIGSKKDGPLKTIPGILPDPTASLSGCRFKERCPLKIERCEHERPVLRKIFTNHRVACHLPPEEKGAYR
jgi:oligopeptide/dipeptide ABC transporter ATP-binding protein